MTQDKVVDLSKECPVDDQWNCKYCKIVDDCALPNADGMSNNTRKKLEAEAAHAAQEPPMSFGPFLERKEGVTYKCNVCLDYGGLLEENGRCYPDGEPVTQVCNCQLAESIDEPQPSKPSTPAAAWRVSGEPDPHGSVYDCERAKLCMGKLTDDELANGAFMNYDVRPDVRDIIAGKAFSPIAWMTAVKERIRWLSRRLVESEQREKKVEVLLSCYLNNFDDKRSVQEALDLIRAKK